VSDEPTRALPVLRTVGQAHLVVLRRMRHFLLAAFLPALLMAGIFFLRGRMPALPYGLNDLAGIGLHAFPLVLFSLHWLRGIDALAPGDGAARRAKSPAAARFAVLGLSSFLALLLSPYFAVLLVVLAVQISCWLIGAPQSSADTPLTAILVLWVGLVVLWYLLAGRLLLGLAAIVQHAGASLREIWRRTRGEGHRITAALLLVTLTSFLFIIAASFAGGVVGALAAAMSGDAQILQEANLERVVVPAVVIAFALVLTALISSVLHLAHRHLYEGPRGPAKEILVAFD
jgi:hypothetical protein